MVTRAYSEHSGGMERLSFELVAALRQARTSVFVVAHQGSRRSSPLFSLWCIPRVLWHARRADIVQLGDPMLSLAGWLVKKIFSIPVVVVVHGLDITYPNALYQWYLRLFFGRFDHYVAISRHVAGLLKGRGIRRVSVINPGITDRHFDSSRTRSDLEDVLKKDLKQLIVLTTVGRVVERKGQAWFVRHVLPKLPGHFLYVVVGSGPGETALQQAIHQTNLDDRVIILGRCSDDVLKTIYNTVDAFIQPNIAVLGDVEGFGLVLLEAAICQRPVYAAQLEGITDAIAQTDIGRLLPSGDPRSWIAALQHLSISPPHISARAAVKQHFDWSKIIREYLSLYAALAAAKQTPS